MNTDRVTTIDTGSSLDYGCYTLANYFLQGDYSNSANHRYLPISVINPDEKIGEPEIKTKKKATKPQNAEVSNMFKNVEEY